MIKNIKIRTKLVIGTMFFVLTTILIMFIVINRMDYLSNLTKLMYSHPLTVSNAVLRLDGNITRIDRTMKELMISKSLAKINENLRIIENYNKDIYEDFELIEERFLGDPKMYTDALNAYENWEPVRNEIILLLKKNKKAEAIEITEGRGEFYIEKLKNVMSKLDSFAQNKAKEFLNSAFEIRKKTVFIVIIIASVLTLIATVFFQYLINSIIDPLKKLINASNDINEKNLDKRITLVSKDEVGILTESFNLMIDRIKESKEKLEEKVLERTSELRNSHKRYRELLENAMTAIIKVDKNGYITFANEFACELFEYDYNELIGKAILGTLLPKFDSEKRDLSLMLEDYMNTDKMHFSVVNENENITKTGKRLWMAWRNKALLDENGNFEGIISAGIDISKRIEIEKSLKKAKQNAEEANRTKSKFLANMSHELRTPLNGILGFSQVLESIEEDKEKKEMLAVVLGSGEHLLNLIGDILDLSKIEAGEMKLSEKDFNLIEILEKVRGIFEKRVESKGINFEIDGTGIVYSNLLGDDFRIEQLIINLIGNAVKFTEKGYIKIRVDQSEKYTEFRIEDSGIGIDEKTKNRIFDKFVQGENSISRKYGGSGLGLSIVKDLIEMMNGSIEVESKLGLGSKFIVKIPIKKSNHAVKMDKKKDKKYIENKEGKTVLIAENDNMNISLMESIFKNYTDLKFEIAENGVEVIKKLEEKKFDLILMDVEMPKLNGLETTRKIRESKKAYKDIKIIALTSYALKGDREKVLESGMNDYLSKPIKISRLIEKINNYI